MKSNLVNIDDEENEDIKLDINTNNRISISKINKIVKDPQLLKLQQNLLMMGFDIDIINKIIYYFNIRNVNDALDYLVKTDTGMWNHPFIEAKKDRNSINNQNDDDNGLIGSVINKVKTMTFERDICEICGEKKEFHSIINKDEDNKIIKEDDNDNFLKFILDISKNEYSKELEEKEEEDIDDGNCPLCLDPYEKPVKLQPCNHQFCEVCFSDYINNLINTNNIENIPCPRVKCKNKSITAEFFSQYISENQLIKYNQFKTQNEIAKDKLKIFCPLCTSFAKIDNPEKYDTNNELYKKSTLICTNGHEFCSCGRTKHEGECYHDTDEFKDLIIKEKIKQCPKCGFLIKKNNGCNHMTCGNKACRYEFCWLCLKESLPDHYETGPCAGLQFVDPDSYWYQLEQKYPFLFYVFTALKILLLILLILLALGAPSVILCLFCYFTLRENYYMSDDDVDKMYTLPKYLCIFHFLICVPVLLAAQSLGYLASSISIIVLLIYGIIKFFSFLCSRHEEEEDLLLI